MTIREAIDISDRWFRDELLRKLFRNAGVLLSGNLAASILGLVSLAITARSLGPEKFGTLVLVSTYVLIIGRLASFQAWQALIKYGAESLERRRDDELRSLIKFGIFLDGGSSAIGAIIGVSGAYVIGRLFEWPQAIVYMAMLYSLVIISNLSGTPTAILRLFDQFQLVAVHQLMAGLMRLFIVSSALIAGAGLWGFMFAWIVADVIGNILLLGFGWYVLKRKHIDRIMTSPLKGISRKYQGLWMFVLTTHMDSSVRIGRELDVPFVGLVLTVEAVALFKVAKQLSSVLSKLLDTIYQVIYPELSRLNAAANHRDFVTLVLRMSVILGLVGFAAWVGYLLVGQKAIATMMGESYSGAYAVSTWCMLAMVIWAFAQPLAPAMLALGQYSAMFRIHLITTLGYIGLLYFLVPRFHLIGAGVAFLAFYLSWAICMGMAFKVRVSRAEVALFAKV